MKKIILTALLVIPAVLMTSCKKNEVPGQINGNVACVEWGVTQEDVAMEMINFKLQSSTADYMFFHGFGNFERISYLFENGLLKASMVVVEESKTSEEAVDYLFKDYFYLGEMNGAKVYINEKIDVFATVVLQSHQKKSYYAIGYTSLKGNQE